MPDRDAVRIPVRYWLVGPKTANEPGVKRQIDRDVAAGRRVEVHGHAKGVGCVGFGCTGYAKFYG